MMIPTGYKIINRNMSGSVTICVSRDLGFPF